MHEPPSAPPTQAKAGKAPAVQTVQAATKPKKQSGAEPQPPALLDVATELADRLAVIQQDHNEFLKRAAQELDIDDAPIHFRRHGPNDIGIAYSLQLFVGGQRVEDMSGNFPFQNLLDSTQRMEAFARAVQIMKFTIMEPFLSLMARRISDVALTEATPPALMPAALPPSAKPTDPSATSLADING